jgi:hypothetical protein
MLFNLKNIKGLNKLRTYEEMKNKTIANVHQFGYDDDELCLQFTDGSFIVIRACSGNDPYIDTCLSDKISHDEMLKLGAISENEYHEIENKLAKKHAAQTKKNELAMLKMLKEKYETASDNEME